ncbi:MAG: beta-galactosidase [Blautia sp.]|nr:beta-galactosidase [Blautia sp.]
MIYQFAKYKKSEILRNHLNLGGENADGERIGVTSLYFEKNGRPWIGVMGEYHFSRDSRENWYRELRKMKAGGVTIVSTYVFWNYHEEMEGVFDFEGDRDLRAFLAECRQAGLQVFLRIGPWAHGECRNGGFPDWLLQKAFPLREDHPEYLAKVRTYYERIYQEAEGSFFRDGGPIIGIQIENELVDDPGHLLTLTKLAKEIGFEAPLWTVTGWNSLYGAKIPVDEFVPVFGAYAEAPWEPHTRRLPLSKHYVFDPNRNDSAIGMDIMGKTDSDGWKLPYERYPFATCEIGAGLPFSHHRRAVVSGMDAYALSLIKLGSGNNLVGYYMYHGGTNKIGTFTTLQESRATGYPNDYAILNYDFHTCLSQYGEVREQYRLLNLLNLFVRDFGETLAKMEYVPSEKTVSVEDLESLRYCMRTDGESGFVFINHYQRLAKLEDVQDVVIDTGKVSFPPIRVRRELSFFFPFQLKIGEEVLEYATAQPLCKCGNTYFFVAIPGVEPRYKFEGKAERSAVRTAAAGKEFGDGFHRIQEGTVTIVTLPFETARYLRRLDGQICLGDHCDLYLENDQIQSVQGGRFTYYVWENEGFVRKTAGENKETATLKKEAVEEPFLPQYLEELNLGGERKRTWKKLTVSSEEGFIELTETYDVAQIYADGELIADNFYYGEPWRIPAKLLYGKETYLVMSELRDDFYREFSLN